MLKHKSKILALAIVSLLLFNTFSFADEPVTTSLDNTAADETASVQNETVSEATEDVDYSEDEASDATTLQSSIVSEDQYLFGDDITMDKLVDGNVYIFGNNVTISGRVAGNLFVAANKVTFTEDSVIQYSAFVSAKEVQFNGAAYDLYNFSNNITFGSTALIGRDFRTLSNSVDLKGIIIRNAIVASPTITLPEATTSTAENSTDSGALLNNSNFIYGSLIYYSDKELNVPEGFVQSGVFANKLPGVNTSTSNTVMTYITGALTFILFTLFLYGAMYLRKNASMEKSKELVKSKVLPMLGFGLLSLVVLLIAGFGFLLANITLPIGLLLFAILLFAIFISLPFATIMIANILTDKLPIAKGLVVLITSIVVWALTLIPYLNIILYFIAIIFTLGYLLLNTYTTLDSKEEKKDEKVQPSKEEKK